MATWESQTSPLPKLENSPTESFISTPGDMYPPLFSAPTPTPDTMDPMQMMTPPASSADENAADAAVLSALGTVSTSTSGTPATPTVSKGQNSEPATEKKPAKKRKSWGQILPEPKTNLPPRKRAKTEDEKEQRRVERVLRNRRAAQSSRERKRQEVELLEKRNQELEARLIDVEKANLMLVEELHKYRRSSGVVTRTSSPMGSLQSNTVTFSSELFSSQDGHKPLLDGKSSLMDSLVMSEPSNPTVNPSSLSPASSPAPEPEPSHGETPTAASNPTAVSVPAPEASRTESSPDLTQRPAAMLCDLQCHQSTDALRSLMSSPTMAVVSALRFQMFLLIWATVSTCQRPLTQIAMSLKAGFSLPPTRSILRTIIWLVTRPRSTRKRSTFPSSSTTTTTDVHPTLSRPAACTSQPIRSGPPLPSLKIHSLRKILTCSPNLARPLRDATMEALRLVSEGCDDQAGRAGTHSSMTHDGSPKPPQWLEGFSIPSREALMTLLWALDVEARKSKRIHDLSDPLVDIHTLDRKRVFLVAPRKRKRDDVMVEEFNYKHQRQDGA